MGDISVKGKSPILTKGQRLLSRGKKQKAKIVVKYKPEKPEPEPEPRTKQQR